MLIRKFKSTHIGYQDQNLPKIKIDMIFYYRCAVYQWISLTSVEQPTGQMKILYLFTQLKPSNDKQEQTINLFSMEAKSMHCIQATQAERNPT